jgi:hypothetical protein
MARIRKEKALTPEEKLFLKIYVESTGIDSFEAIREAKIPYMNEKSARQKAQLILAKPAAQAYIEDCMNRKLVSFRLSEEEILQGIYQEAKYFGEGASHAARINAWVQLGKHFGMFSEKKQETSSTPSITYNVVNYNEGILGNKIEKEIKITPQESKIKEEVQTLIPELSIEIEEF